MFAVKRILTALLWLLSLGLAASAQAQSHPQAPTQKADTLLLGERTEGDYVIRTYRIERAGERDYAILYRINLARLNPNLGRNPAELQALDGLFQSLVDDSLKQVRHIAITGYASPDGPQTLNERLSKARMTDFATYAQQKYPQIAHLPMHTASVAEDWGSCHEAVINSSIPDKEAVLQILQGAMGHEEKERALKRLRGAWAYLAREILPSLRRVEMVVNYSQGAVVEDRMMIPKPQPQPQPQTAMSQTKPSDPCGECLVVDEGITGWIVAYPEKGERVRRRDRR